MSNVVATGWAIKMPNGFVSIDISLHATEHGLWNRMCMYTPDVIDFAKQQGAGAFRVEVREID